MEDSKLELELPGFRFHPTEEELLDFYLKKMVLGKNMRLDIIGYLNIYHYDPWSLPGLAKIDGKREWYFFVPRDRKHGSGGRPNRTTENGFWKATGSDRKIFGLSDPKKQLGLKKTLVFYKGRAPRGSKTDWVMNEYRLPDSCQLPKDIVLCKIYRKATSLKVLEQRAAMGEEMKAIQAPPSPFSTTTTTETTSFSIQNHHDDSSSVYPPMESCHVDSVDDNDNELLHHLLLMLESNTKDEPQETSYTDDDNNNNNKNNSNNDNLFRLNMSSLKLPMGNDKLPELQLPSKLNMDWHQDYGAQLCSPWLEIMTLTPPAYANILNL